MERVPERRAAEAALTALTAAASAIPVVGGMASVLLEQSVRPVLRRRQVEFIEGLAASVCDLQARADEFWSFEALAGDENFASAVASALRVVSSTAQEAKLEALRNAVLNSVGPEAPSEFEQAMFFRFVDELDPLHLQMLQYGMDPSAWYEARATEMPGGALMGSPRQPFDAAFADWDDEIRDVVLNDLSQRRLLALPGGGITSTPDAVRQKLTSPLGDRFYNFVMVSPLAP